MSAQGKGTLCSRVWLRVAETAHWPRPAFSQACSQPASIASKKKVKIMVDADSLEAVKDLMGGMKKDKRLAASAQKLLVAVEAMGIVATAGATI